MQWFLDTETTGLSGPAIEVALVPERGEGWSTLIDQGVPIEAGALAVHGITEAECRAKGITEAGAASIIGANLKDGDVVWCHNVSFDRKRIEGLFAKAGVPMPKVEWRCTLEWSRRAVAGSHRLADLAVRLGFKVGGHRAMGDAVACRELYFHLVKTIDLRVKRDYVRVEGCRIVWGTYYTKSGMAPEYKEFEVRAVDFKTKRFVAWDVRKDEKREYRFDRFTNRAVVDAIVSVMA